MMSILTPRRIMLRMFFPSLFTFLACSCQAPTEDSAKAPSPTSTSSTLLSQGHQLGENDDNNTNNFHNVVMKDQFAQDRLPQATKEINFDGEQAIKYLNTLCDLGPRISGTEAMTRQQKIIMDHFEKLGAFVFLQKFEGKQPSQLKPVPMANIIISFHPQASKRVLL